MAVWAGPPEKGDNVDTCTRREEVSRWVTEEEVGGKRNHGSPE